MIYPGNNIRVSGVPIVKTGSAERTGFEIKPSERKIWGKGISLLKGIKVGGSHG